MKIHEILQRNPATHALVNQGQARIADKTNDKVLSELKGELSAFVCEGQYSDGIQRILSSFLANINHTSQKAAWVSGFFGSGKSHLLKMLCHLWADTKFPDGSTARSLVPVLPDEIRELLRELDTLGKRSGGLLAAAGALPSGTTDNVRLTILSILFRAVGLPDQYPQAQFCLWLKDEGWLDSVKTAVESAGKAWSSELNNLYVSGLIARALLDCDRKLGNSEAEVRNTLKAQFPPRTSDITTQEFVAAVRRVLKLVGRDGRIPCTVLVLDEVQQYIGDSNDRSVIVTEVAEAVSKQLDSHVLLVASGQSALSATPLLQKLNDRFPIRVQLSDQDVENVIRKVLLQKRPTAVNDVRELLEKHSGEVSRQLQGTRISESASDRDTIVGDYPLLPTRRRFWEHCFRAVDAAGTHSQLRSQLKIVHDSMAKISSKNLGSVISGDELFEALAPEMVNTGVLLREINERIINLSKGDTEEGRLSRRVCGVIFLISKLPREAGADIGVRATREHIADLLIDDLAGDNGKLRAAVGSVLDKLAASGQLMRVGDEFRLQTKEGAEWDLEFRNRQTRLASDEASIQIRRDQLVYGEADRIIRGLKFIQGASKEARQVTVSRDQTPPVQNGETVPLWIRDGWAASEKEILDAARAAGVDSPTVSMFVPKQSAEDLRKLIVDAEAAQQTIDARGVPSTREGEEAKQSMESRRNLAVRQREELIRQIVANAKVYQGGGNELMQLSLDERIKDAVTTSLARLFPRFRDADSAAWEASIKRAKEGSEQPLVPVGHSGPTEQHPVCQAVLSTIGAGKTGAEVRKTLKASPYGWPQDAIDAALIALSRTQHISVMLNGTVLPIDQLDQNKISKAEFRVQKITLGIQDRLAIRKLFQSIGVSCRQNEEQLKVGEFFEKVFQLVAEIGGESPLPPPPQVRDLEDMRSLVGNEQLAALRAKADDLEKQISEWSKLRGLKQTRRPIWETVEKFARHAVGLPGSEDFLRQIDAVRSGRLLLDPSDLVSPIRGSLAEILRKAIIDIHASMETQIADANRTLESSSDWSRLTRQDRERLLQEVKLTLSPLADISSDSNLSLALETASISARKADLEAISGRVQRALELAAKILEPKVRPVFLERSTLKTEADVRRWLDSQEKRLLSEIKDGPVLVS